MTSATRKPSASQSRVSTSSSGLSSRASDSNRSAIAAALSPRDAKTGISCLVPAVTITGVAACSSVTGRPVVPAGGHHTGLLVYCNFHTVNQISEWPACPGLRAVSNDTGATSHVVVGLVVQHVAHKQDDRLAPEVLPPMRGAAGLGADITGLVHDWNRAVAGVFDDLALRDIDDRGSIAVAMPRHDAPWFDRKLAEPELALLDVCRLFFEIDGGQHGVGNALARVGDRLTCVGFHFVGRAATGKRGRHADQRRPSRDAGQNNVSAEASGARHAIEHVRVSSVGASPGGRLWWDRELTERSLNGNAEWLLNRYTTAMKVKHKIAAYPLLLGASSLRHMLPRRLAMSLRACCPSELERCMDQCASTISLGPALNDIGDGSRCHGHRPSISRTSVQLRKVRTNTSPASRPRLIKVNSCAMDFTISAATSTSRPSRSDRPMRIL